MRHVEAESPREGGFISANESADLSGRAICTTVIRGATTLGASGRILEVDLASGEVTASHDLTVTGSLLGPRGGNRGGRGVRVFNGRIYVAAYNRILIYDETWRLAGEVRHPHIAGHHEIEVDSEGIWCCSTLVDAVFKIDFEGNVLFQWWASEEAQFVEWVRRSQAPWEKAVQVRHWDKGADYSEYIPPVNDERHEAKQFHINSVSVSRGSVYAFDSNYGAFFCVWPAFKKVVLNRRWFRAHNVGYVGERLAVNNSPKKTFELWELPLKLRSRTRISKGILSSTQFSRPGWVRGRIDLGLDDFIVGANPPSLHRISDGRLVKSVALGQDVNEAVHGLTIHDGEPREEVHVRPGVVAASASSPHA